MKPSQAILTIGLFLTLLAFAFLYAGDSSLANGREVTFTDPAGDQIYATYHLGQIEGPRSMSGRCKARRLPC